MSEDYRITRPASSPICPTHKRNSRSYYLLSLYLREHPPNETSFRIKDLCNLFNVAYTNMYQTLRTYHRDSKEYITNIFPPTEISEDDSWIWAIEQLHQTGFYMIQPTKYHSGEWGEPDFRQFEDYTTRYLKEGLNRVKTRLQDGVTFNLKLDGINVRQALEYINRQQRMLTDYKEEDKS